MNGEVEGNKKKLQTILKLASLPCASTLFFRFFIFLLTPRDKKGHWKSFWHCGGVDNDSMRMTAGGFPVQMRSIKKISDIRYFYLETAWLSWMNGPFYVWGYIDGSGDGMLWMVIHCIDVKIWWHKLFVSKTLILLSALQVRNLGFKFRIVFSEKFRLETWNVEFSSEFFENPKIFVVRTSEIKMFETKKNYYLKKFSSNPAVTLKLVGSWWR